jgi:hypothetical protein
VDAHLSPTDQKRTIVVHFWKSFQLFASYVRRNGSQIVFDAPDLSKKKDCIISNLTYTGIYGYNFEHRLPTYKDRP